MGKGPQLKAAALVSPYSVGSKVFEKLLNNRLTDHLEKCGLISNFQYGFRSAQSATDLLTVVSKRIARALIDLGLLELQHLISRIFDRVWHAGLIHKLKSYGVSV